MDSANHWQASQFWLGLTVSPGHKSETRASRPVFTRTIKLGTVLARDKRWFTQTAAPCRVHGLGSAADAGAGDGDVRRHC